MKEIIFDKLLSGEITEEQAKKCLDLWIYRIKNGIGCKGADITQIDHMMHERYGATFYKERERKGNKEFLYRCINLNHGWGAYDWMSVNVPYLNRDKMGEKYDREETLEADCIKYGVFTFETYFKEVLG